MAPPQPLRIAIFGESYLPYLSGVTIATDALARGLMEVGHQVLLVMPRPAHEPPPPAPHEPAVAWLPSYQPPTPAPPGYRIPIPRPSGALRAARAFRPQVVHAQSVFGRNREDIPNAQAIKLCLLAARIKQPVFFDSDRFVFIVFLAAICFARAGRNQFDSNICRASQIGTKRR